MASRKPDQILWLEKQIGVPLHPLKSGKVSDYENRTCYELDANGHVIGLNIRRCRISTPSILEEFPKLTSLNLSGDNISDWSFLKRMSQLASLDLSSNNISDWSFLKGMSQLTSLYLYGDSISDGSFLKGLSQLTSLTLSNSTFTNVSFLKGMSQLTSLYLHRSNISDWSFLKGMNQLTLLDLSQNTISDVSFLKEMSQLTLLDLSFNDISDWSFLKEMNQLTSLILSRNTISDVSFLKEMSQLTSLNLSRNNISDASFLKEMSQLTSLYLSGNDITDGSFLKGMSQLTSLDLSWNSIHEGSFLKGMSQLTSLDLSGNNITDGSFLKGLSQLASLDLSGNNISDGSFLKGISQLTSLYLSGNGITDGSFLKGMSQLTSLSLSENNITDWSFLKGMSQLTSLDLSQNGITDGSFLKEMSQLTSLDLRRNKFLNLPSGLYEWDIEIRSDEHFTLPYSINIASNPFKEPPLEIVEQGHVAIIDWYHASQEGEIDINEVKVILVGDGSAGKTTVRKRLMGLNADPKESQTHGIEINDHEIECHGRKILAHFWDFGGQEIMHATHQFFLSRRSLYILVLDGRKEEDTDYWLKHIESFGGDSPILVCLNKIDQNPSFEVDCNKLKIKYPGIQEFYRLKSLDESDSGIKRLIEELPRQIAQVEMSRSKWPIKWSKVKKRLQRDNKPFIDQNKFQNICKREQINDESKQQTLIRYLNDLGIALHFDDRRLQLVQILNPRWATQAVYRIINDADLAKTHGVLDLKRLPKILKREKVGQFEYPASKLEYVIDLMKKFELCHELPGPGDRILLPDLLGVQEPDFKFSTKDVLRFRFQYEYLPTSILPRIIVQMHADTDDNLRWRTGVVLKMRDGRARAVIRSDKHARRISIEVEGIASREYFAVIRDRFDKIHKEFQKFKVTELVPLPDHPEVVVEYTDLLFYEEQGLEEIPVGKVKQNFGVQKLLNGIESPERRRARRETEKYSINADNVHIHEGPHMSIQNTVTNNVTAEKIENSFNNVIAEKIENCFNKANNATDRPVDIRDLLKSLAEEIKKIVKELPPEKAEEVANDLKTITEESVKEKPVKKYWEVSKKGILEAADAVGAVGATAISLVTKLGPLLGF